jgi:transposase
MTLDRPISDADWQATPEPVQKYIVSLEDELRALKTKNKKLEKNNEKLDKQNRKNSTNSSKPPSSDPPYKKNKREKPKSDRKPGGQKGHPGNQQKLLTPNNTENVMPEQCSCGHHPTHWDNLQPFHTHQHIELPEIDMEITHFVLYQGQCSQCGKIVKAKASEAVSTGYGPRFSAFIAELSGIKAMSRRNVQQLVHSVFDIKIATGTIQKIIDRASEAIASTYERIGQVARSSECNFIDETSWFEKHKLQWLWVMVNTMVAFFRIDPKRSKQAFLELIADWKGILISDGYGLYCKWVHGRQTCLAHLIRKAKALIESRKLNERRGGKLILAHLNTLIEFSKHKPPPLKWERFYNSLLLILSLFEDDTDDAGRLARQIIRELDALWTFLEHDGVEPTNNRAERSLRFGVLWRKCSLGTQSDKGNRWVERILSVKETCRLRDKATFPFLVECLECYFAGISVDVSWI